jgi:hypothetical protein
MRTYPVGDTEYTVETAEAPIFDARGARCASTIVWDDRKILICPTVPAHQIAEVTAAALTSAWKRETSGWSRPVRLVSTEG